MSTPTLCYILPLLYCRSYTTILPYSYMTIGVHYMNTLGRNYLE